MMKLMFVTLIAVLSFQASAEIVSAADADYAKSILNADSEEQFVSLYRAAPESVKAAFRDRDVRASILAKSVLAESGWRLRQLNNISRITKEEAIRSMYFIWKTHGDYALTCKTLAPYSRLFPNIKNDLPNGIIWLQLQTCEDSEIGDISNQEFKLAVDKVASENNPGMVSRLTNFFSGTTK